MKGHLHKQGKYWYLTVDVGKSLEGKRKRKNINTECIKKADAKLKQAEIILELNKGEFSNFIQSQNKISYSIEEEENKDSNILFTDYMIEWLEVYVKPNCEQTTYDGYKVIIDKHIVNYFEGINLTELRPANIQNYYDHLLIRGRVDGKGGLSPTTIKAHHNIIRKSLSRAFMLEIINSNPARNVELPKRKKYEAKIYNIEEIKILLKTAIDEPINIAIWLASSLGLRRGEVIGLRWDDIDFKKDVIHIRNTRVQTSAGILKKTTKTLKGNRVLPIPKHLKRYLEELYRKQMKNKLSCGKGYKEGNYIVAWDDGSPVKPDYVSRRFTRILELNNLPKIRFHDLRHSNATLLLEQNINMKWISEWLGHSTISTTMDIYGHITDKIKLKVATELDEIFSECN